jgi:hypothetical protein
VLNGAESKDPGGAYLAYAAGSFSTTEARSWQTRHGLPWTENKCEPPEESFVLVLGLVVEKLRAAWVDQSPSRSFDSAPQALCHAIDP